MVGCGLGVVPRVSCFFVCLEKLFSFPFHLFSLPGLSDGGAGVAGMDRAEGNGENELFERFHSGVDIIGVRTFR